MDWTKWHSYGQKEVMHLLQGINKKQRAESRPSANGGFLMPVGSDVLTLGWQLCFLQGPNQAIQKQQSRFLGLTFAFTYIDVLGKCKCKQDLDYFCLCLADWSLVHYWNTATCRVGAALAKRTTDKPAMRLHGFRPTHKDRPCMWNLPFIRRAPPAKGWIMVQEIGLPLTSGPKKVQGLCSGEQATDGPLAMQRGQIKSPCHEAGPIAIFILPYWGLYCPQGTSLPTVKSGIPWLWVFIFF